MNSSGFEGGLYVAIIGYALMIVWYLLLLAGLLLASFGAYRRYSHRPWKPFFVPGAVLFCVLIGLTFWNPSYYAELASDGWFCVFLRSFILLLPLAMTGFGIFLGRQPATRFPGILFGIAGILGAISSLPFILDPILKILSGGGPAEMNQITRISYPFLQQIGLLRLLAEIAGMAGLVSCLKQSRTGVEPVSTVPQPVVKDRPLDS